MRNLFLPPKGLFTVVTDGVNVYLVFFNTGIEDWGLGIGDKEDKEDKGDKGDKGE
ncbi:hypothetical protein F7734_22455 [Scytonema sp. UIC 10036]|nr:hypothetical protein [Scytonema sp. UIC 10036]